MYRSGKFTVFAQFFLEKLKFTRVLHEEWFCLMYLLFCFSHCTFLGVVLLVLAWLKRNSILTVLYHTCMYMYMYVC